ncbi:uncharacterized protein LOC111863791 isoform X2 [Cryptotermes secundus]|uniref:uncharacterized protein LOC111863791 isoform X2 n=1 Tax=Cryptotermes secundus TaxID=105785 RepID=UPI000CD7C9D5|nr:uncharacterized protein LOC111863791 isoform X2 [Cryptotermes secundus]
MAGREKKILGNKQLGVKKEIDKTVKVTETTKEDETSIKTRELKQVQKDVYQGKKSTLKKRSTGGTKSRKSLESTEAISKDSSSSIVESATGGKTARGSQNPKLRQTSKLNKTVTSQSGTNSANELFALSNDTKRSQSPRLCKTNKVSKGAKQGSKTLEEASLSDDSNINILSTKAQSPKLRRLVTQNKLGTGSPDVRNGSKGRNTPYITRSDSPARVLRNGKRRRLKDPSLLEGLDVGFPKRRRLLSTTRDGSGSELGSKGELCLDDQSSVAGSDSSVSDFPRLENGKGSCDSDCDSKIPLDETKNEEHSPHSVHSSPCSENQSQIYHDKCLGKSISNRITELIHRNKFLESVGKALIPKAEEKLVSTKPSELSETDFGKFIENEKKLTDTNFNLCGPESVASEKTDCDSAEHQCSHDCSTHNTSSETKEKDEDFLPAAGKVTASENADLKELEHKNGQNLSIDIALYHLREKSARKVRDLKITKNKKFFQECPSSSGVFYVVQNPSNVPFQKEGVRSVLPLCSGENQGSVTCTDAQLASRDILVLNSSIKEKESAESENFASAEGCASSVSARDVVKDSLNVCAGQQLEEESIPVLSQTVVCEADVSCVSDFSVDRKRCSSSIDSKKDAHGINSDIKDDSSTVILDWKMDCESAVSEIKIDYNKLNSLESMDCENADIRDVEVNKNSGVRVETDNNNDPVSTDSALVDNKKVISKEDFVMGTGFKNDCKETVDIKFDYNDTVNDTSSVTDCKEISHDCSSTTNKSQKPVFLEIPETSDHNVNAVLEPVIHTDFESDVHEVGRNIRRSTRSSVGKVRAAMLHCMTAGRMKQTKLDSQEKSQDVIKTDAESLSICSTDDGSTMDSEDVAFSTGKTLEMKGKQNDVQEKNEEVKGVEVEEDEAAVEANILGKVEDMLLHTGTTAMTAQDILSKESLCHINDIHIKEGDLCESKGNSLHVDKLVIEKKNETSEKQLDISVLKESVVDCENIDEGDVISDQENEKRIPELKMDISDVIDFTNVSTEKIISCEDLFDSEPNVKEESRSTDEVELCSKLKDENDDKLPAQNTFVPQIVAHMKKGKVDSISDGKVDNEKDVMNNVEKVLVHKLQNAIEPALFYSKENLKDVMSQDSEDKSSDVTGKMIMSDISESHCESKHHTSICTNEEFPSSTPECSGEDGQACDNNRSLIEEVFQKKVIVEQCDMISEGVMSDVNSILHDVKQLEEGESLHEVSGFISSSVVESSEILDDRGSDSKVSDSKNMFVEEEVSPEEQAIKESVLSALGLQPLRATQVGTSGNTKGPFGFGIGSRKCLKPPYSYRYFDISSSPQFTADKSSPGDSLSQEISSKDDGKAQSTKQSGNLVIPEKSSSFSIHPGRLCSDVCSYCFGKFGSLDTPCHIAQLKSSERQQKVLQTETHLTADSCLCDACYRHVDRKANCPSYKPNRKRQHHRSGSSQIKTSCCVQGCSQIAEHHVRRKWLLKLKRSIAKKVQIDMDKMPPHLPFPMCLEHYSWIDYYMVCGICKRRLTRNHMYPLGPEVHELNTALASDGIPVCLSDKLFVCKLCRYFSSVRLKYKDPSQLAGNHKLFFQGYRKRLLHFHDIEEMDEETAKEAPPKPKRRKTKASSSTTVKVDGEDDSGTKSKCELTSHLEDQRLTDTFGAATADFSILGDASIDRSGASTPMIDYSSLGNGTSNLISFEDIGSSHKQTLKLQRVKPTKLKLKFSSGKIGSLNYDQSEGQSTRSILLPERDGLEVTPIHDSLSTPFYPGEEELPLHANFDFHGRKEEGTANRRGEWEKCTATIQFDKDTKSLFQQLQRPYGNHSSFFRHLILLEKYWRSGELILASSASSKAVNYVNSVQNRIHAYEGCPSSTFTRLKSPCSSLPQFSSTTSAMPVPVIDLPLKRRLGEGILTAADGSLKPITITRMSGISISPRPGTFTSLSSAGGVSSSQSRVPVFTSFPQNSSCPAPQKVIVDTIATSAGSHFQHSKRVPNVLQVTAGGKSFSIVPGLTQIRHIQAIQQQQHRSQRQQQQQGSSCFEPMICDVRSLATENGAGLWDQNVTEQSGNSKQQPNISVSLLPKTNASTAFKPSTIVTPTGIVLSRKPEISVTTVTEKKDVALKPKAISGKRESVSKDKPVSEKLDLMRAKVLLEKEDTMVLAPVAEMKAGLPQAKC